jgi:GTP-binding protein
LKFVDEVRIRVEAGAGGDGCVSFRREAGVPRGGPDGGNGGDGGSVFLTGSRALGTLADLQYHNRYRAGRGVHGKGSDMTGRSGEDVLVSAPLGTDVYDADSGAKVGELIAEGAQLPVATGGKGGRGNAAFKTHDNVAPRIHETGKPGEQRNLKLVLRVMSDIGLVGFPNAGKSTLLSKLTRALPKIAEYPFTTLTPNLGALQDDLRCYTVADLPGIIEGAAAGKGLGLRFLRHIERTRMLVFVIDASRPDPLDDYRALGGEIQTYNPLILEKLRILVYNKSDLVKGRIKKPAVKIPFVALSALTGKGIDRLDALLKATMERAGARDESTTD